ncbi:MAG: restriction endonuclease subunit S [Candidatus Anstonellales archaeon]
MAKIRFDHNLPKGWRKVKLGEAADFTKGRKPSRLVNKKLSANLKEYILLGNEKFYTELDKLLVDVIPSDILIVADGASSGTILAGKEGVLGSTLVRIRIKNEVQDEIDAKFLYFGLKHFERVFQSVLTGSAIPHIDQKNLRDFELFIPEDINEQKRIAEILSAFDEKIELNNKINKILEEMAQTIFKEWFNENSKFKKQKAKLGKWQIGYLGDGICSEIIKPGVRKFNREKTYLATTDVVKNEIVNERVKIAYNNRPIRANSEPVMNSIWFAKMIHTYKVLFFFEGNKDDIERYILSTGFMGIKALRNMQYYLYLFINSERFHQIKDTLVQGAVQEAITNANVKEIKILIPPENLINKFNEKVQPLITKIFQNKGENQKLAALRDLLLPKLMSGEIKI